MKIQILLTSINLVLLLCPYIPLQFGNKLMKLNMNTHGMFAYQKNENKKHIMGKFLLTNRQNKSLFQIEFISSNFYFFLFRNKFILTISFLISFFNSNVILYGFGSSTYIIYSIFYLKMRNQKL